MCKQCELKPIYEFTNKRKLCRRCFIKYFQKKVLYTIRKFKMIENNDIIGYENLGDFREAVLEDVLNMYGKKGNVDIIKLSSLLLEIKKNLLNESLFVNRVKCGEPKRNQGLEQHQSASEQRKRAKLKIDRIAVPLTIDIEAGEIIKEIIEGNEKNLKKFKPVNKKIIKPLYLFLDEEVLLYAKLRRLKFKRIKEKEDKITKFVDDLEKKHPEVKRAIVNSYLELYSLV